MQERPQDRENGTGQAGLVLLARPLIPGVVARQKEAQNAVSQQPRRFCGTSSVGAEAIGEGEGR
jgi:hypothetical protein